MKTERITNRTIVTVVVVLAVVLVAWLTGSAEGGFDLVRDLLATPE